MSVGADLGVEKHRRVEAKQLCVKLLKVGSIHTPEMGPCGP